jgi:hypothetical protein
MKERGHLPACPRPVLFCQKPWRLALCYIHISLFSLDSLVTFLENSLNNNMGTFCIWKKHNRFSGAWRTSVLEPVALLECGKVSLADTWTRTCLH